MQTSIVQEAGGVAVTDRAATRQTGTDGPRERERRLATGLAIMTALNAIFSVFYLAHPASVSAAFPAFTAGVSALLATNTLANLACLALVWRWRRIGVYGFALVAAVACGVHSFVGVPQPVPFVGLIGPIILALLVRTQWSLFV